MLLTSYRLAPRLVTGPDSNLATLAEAKRHLLVDHTDDDDLITSLIAAASAHLDGYNGVLRRAVLTQTWEQDFEAFAEELPLPLEPVASVTSVTYTDAAGAEQTLDAGVYELRRTTGKTFVRRQADQRWPEAVGDITVRYVAGGASVPAPIKHAVLLLVGHWYKHREAVGDVSAPIALTVDRLCAPWRLKWI